MKKRNLIACIGLSLFNILGAAKADSSEPIKIISPFAAGGTNDVLARIIAKFISAKMNRPVVVEQRVGAGGRVGTADFVARTAREKGNVLLMASVSTHSIAPSLFKDLQYNTETDFYPITNIANGYQVLVINPAKTKINSVADVVKLASQRPDRLSFGSAGQGTISHLAASVFQHFSNTKMLHVPYKSDANAINELLSGEIDMMFASLPSVAAHVRAGKLRAIAVTSPSRLNFFPNTPTFKESGYPEFVIEAWYGLFGAKGIDPVLAKAIQESIKVGLAAPETNRMLSDVLGVEAVADSPAEFSNFLSRDQQKWKKMIRDSKIVISE